MSGHTTESPSAMIRHLVRGMQAGALGAVAQRAAPALLFIALARISGPGPLGIVAYALSVVALAGAVADLGIPVALQKCMHEYDRAEDVALTALVIRLASAALVALVLLRLGIGPAISPRVAALVAGCLVLVTFDLVPSALNATLRFADGARTSAIANGVFLTGGVAAAAVGLPVTGPIASRAAGSLGAGLPRVLHWIAAGGLPRFTIGQRLLSYGLVAMVPGLMSAIFNQADVVIIGNVLGYGTAGIYKTAVTVAAVPTILAPIIATPLQPLIAHYGRQSSGTVGNLAVGTTELLLLVAAPILAIGAACADPVLRAVAGDVYAAGAPAMILLLSGNLLGLIITPFLSLLLMTEGARIVAAVATGSAAISVGLNLLLVPRVGLVGAGLASLASYLFGFLVQITLASRALGRWPSASTSTKALGFALATYLAARTAVRALPSSWPPAAAATLGILAGVAVYTILLLVSPPLRRHDVRMVVAALARRRAAG